MSVIIYYNANKTHYQIVRPTVKFDGQWTKLVQHITHSNDQVKNYHSFEIL